MSRLGLLVLAGALSGAGLAAQPAADHALEFFETRVRPLLAERCHGCHGPKTQKSQLRLDHGNFVARGGSRGPVLVPGDPDASRLIRAVRYDDVRLQMPPKRRLASDEVAVLERWVALGAPWPDEPLPAAEPAKPRFDLDARRAAHWCWREVQADVQPPAVDDIDWPLDGLDLFVRHRLQAEGLQPAPPADPATLLRRLCFDLHGLPPTAAQREAFLRDPSPAAYGALVDELLASPQFAVRFARHWLDLVRFAETLGHEYDFAIPNAWRYRDYVVDALDQDLPYDRFVAEHVAGDLLDDPRPHPDGYDQAPIGTMFFWFGDQTHSPVDVRRHTADRIDNQIDVLGKTFLGLTIACARCHDHKFDAISQRDYYGVYGALRSSRYALRPLAALHGADAARDALAGMRGQRIEAATRRWQQRLSDLDRYLIATLAVPQPPERGDDEGDDAFRARRDAWRAGVDAQAAERGLEGNLLRRWFSALRRSGADRDVGHPLHAWVALHRDEEAPEGGDGAPADLGTRWRRLPSPSPAAAGEPRTVVADFRHSGFAGWQRIDGAFGDAPRRDHHVVALADDGTPVVRPLPGRWATSAPESLREQGTINSPDFVIDRRWLWFRACGQGTRVRVVLENFDVIRSPIYGGLQVVLDHERPTWFRIDLEMWRGLRAYLQVHDLRTYDPSEAGADYLRHPGFAALQQAFLTDEPRPDDVRPVPSPRALLGVEPPADDADLARRYADAARAASAALAAGDTLGDAPAGLLAWLDRNRLLAPPTADDDAVLALWRRIDGAVPEPLAVPTISEGSPHDSPVFLRGDHESFGTIAPRGMITALREHAPVADGSGRRQLAAALTDPDNPLVARVMVNRVWHWLFGRGLVPTVDNFGALGEQPSHPELLDWLARRFVRDGWSVKHLVRRIVCSATYRSSSAQPDVDTAHRDPDGRLLHRHAVRRLDGESLRDSLLALAGRLDAHRGGPSVPVHLTPFLHGRGRPDRSGPRDGDGRRSLYLETRRNFLDPFFAAFDTPPPFTTVGRRNSSNVPAQPLALMNDPLVRDAAAGFAARVRADADSARSDAATVAAMYRDAFTRPPTVDELDAALRFLGGCAAAGGDPERPWAELAHALLLTQELRFVR